MTQQEKIQANAVQEQQQRAQTGIETQSMDNADMDGHHEILKGRIKEIEKRYTELKSNFMKLLSTIM